MDIDHLARELGGEVRLVGGTPQLWIVECTPDQQAAAIDAGLRVVRVVTRLVAELPAPPTATAAPPDLTIVSFRDAAAQLSNAALIDEIVAVNGRAFARHPDQWAMTAATLHAAFADDDGTDPDGVFVGLLGGHVVGFHWTRRRVEDVDHGMAAIGEIHVLGVDPLAAPRGTGTALARAGLDHLHRSGATSATLWVEHDNAPAMRLYRSLGFVHHSDDVAFEASDGDTDRSREPAADHGTTTHTTRPTDPHADRPASPYDLDRAEWEAELPNEPSFRVDQIWHGLHRDLTPLSDISTLPRQLRTSLGERFPPALTCVTTSRSDDNRTTKFLWQLRDGHTIETVLMEYDARTTVCVSTQAGCAMRCAFCATGQAGFDRHLSAGEIVEQVVNAARATTTRVSGVVFMGMGEPLANYDATIGAARRLNGDIGIAARRLTVSTVGILNGIRRLAREPLQLTLAVSLHAARDDLRASLVPLAAHQHLDELAAACREYRSASGRRLTFEWAMIGGVNDTQRDAVELAAFVRPLGAHVNLIPLNRTAGYSMGGSDPDTIGRFADELRRRRVNVTVRANRGADIDAACGQLRASSARSDVGVEFRPRSRH